MSKPKSDVLVMVMSAEEAEALVTKRLDGGGTRGSRNPPRLHQNQARSGPQGRRNVGKTRNKNQHERSHERSHRSSHQRPHHRSSHHSHSDSRPNSRPKGVWKGHTFIGDSMLSRVAQQTLRENTKFSRTLRTKQLGLCLHGYTACQMARFLKGPHCPCVGEKAILLIGTNDLVKGVPTESTVGGIKDIVEVLKGKVEKLIISTVPPVPGLFNQQEMWTKLMAINAAIKELDNGTDDRVKVVDILDAFTQGEEINLELFSKAYGDGRTDLTHWNRAGIKVWEEQMIPLL